MLKTLQIYWKGGRSMRLSLYRSDPPRQADMIPAEEAAPSFGKPQTQPVRLSESERNALHSWASKHGFVLRNPADEWLAEAAWRRDVESHEPTA